MSVPVVIWGASGQAKVLREFLPREYELIAVFDNDPDAKSPFADVPIFFGEDGFARWHESAPAVETAFLVAIGGDRGADRLQLQRYLEGSGLKAYTAIHPAAFVASDAVIGKGCHILAGACVGAQVILGEACIVNTGAIIDHECTLGDGAHIGPGAVLAGCVEVSTRVFVGAGAVVLPRVSIGEAAVVGAGAVVIKDVAAGVVVAGNPAQPLRPKGR